jgi:hypothetical protein
MREAIMRCPQCGARADFKEPILGVDFGAFCGDCYYRVWTQIHNAAGVPTVRLVDLLEETAQELVESASRRVVAAARRDPPTTDYREVARRLLEWRERPAGR